MHLNTVERRELNAGRTIIRYFRNANTGEKYAAEIKRSWDKFYYRVDDGPWFGTRTEARKHAGLARP